MKSIIVKNNETGQIEFIERVNDDEAAATRRQIRQNMRNQNVSISIKDGFWTEEISYTISAETVANYTTYRGKAKKISVKRGDIRQHGWVECSAPEFGLMLIPASLINEVRTLVQR